MDIISITKNFRLINTGFSWDVESQKEGRWVRRAAFVNIELALGFLIAVSLEMTFSLADSIAAGDIEDFHLSGILRSVRGLVQGAERVSTIKDVVAHIEELKNKMLITPEDGNDE